MQLVSHEVEMSLLIENTTGDMETRSKGYEEHIKEGIGQDDAGQ